MDNNKETAPVDNIEKIPRRKNNAVRSNSSSKLLQQPRQLSQQRQHSVLTRRKNPISKILLLHGNRQTGELLLGRIERFRKKLFTAYQIDIVAIDAPLVHPLDDTTKTWWHRHSSPSVPVPSSTSSSSTATDEYIGLEDSIRLVQSTWKSSLLSSSPSTKEQEGDTEKIPFVGLIGFSQGARFVHLLSVLQQQSSMAFLPGLQFVIMVAGYDAPLPSNLYSFQSEDNDNDDSSKRNTVLSSTFSQNDSCTIPSLHVWGERDQLVVPQQSSDVATKRYHVPTTHVHDGGHHVPMLAADIQVYLDFIATTFVLPTTNGSFQNYNGYISNTMAVTIPKVTQSILESSSIPDEECALQQHEEVIALEAIYGNDFHLLSCRSGNDDDVKHDYPITFRIDIYPTVDDIIGTSWPVSCDCSTPMSIHVVYPPTYPNMAPIFSMLQSCSNSVPLSTHTNRRNSISNNKDTTASDCVDAMYDAILNELGMPCIMTCVFAAKEFYDLPPSTINGGDIIADPTPQASSKVDTMTGDDEQNDEITNESDDRIHDYDDSTIKKATAERIQQCNLQGLEIAEKLLRYNKSSASSPTPDKLTSMNGNIAEDENGRNSHSTQQYMMGKGGSWTFTIGLVGKPSAGKSTFFNIATGFARQRQTLDGGGGGGDKHKEESTSVQQQQQQQQLGGAAMAPHPFTTINPNVGYCLVPAPPGSCPEDNIHGASNIGSTHGRDNEGRRLLPVLLKDVAGLVPGAYQGRGRGNQFLNDLCDADVLIHVCDASGMADSDGNMILSSDEIENTNHALNGGSDPLSDMAWIRNELIEWVYTNLIRKWDAIRRKGWSKLEGMFSGYGQPLAMTHNLLTAVEKYMIQADDDNQQQRFINPYEQIEDWDTGDIYRLVSAFLGVRFPIALALNKMDVPSSSVHIEHILSVLPVHGTHVATPLSAKREMQFMKRHIIEATMSSATVGLESDGSDRNTDTDISIPRGTWNCLQSAICLCDPILVFPVTDHQTYMPLLGLFRYATSDPSLPSPGMNACIHAAGGAVPSEYDCHLRQYSVPKIHGNQKKSVTATSLSPNVKLRDVIMMKPGSTVNDLYLTLKRMGVIQGEFIRAEACRDVNTTGGVLVAPKPVTKHQLLCQQIRIIKIMTNKRNSWQSTSATSTK